MISDERLAHIHERTLETKRTCEVSMESRRGTADMLRMVYERGSTDGPTALWNKIRSHLDRVASYLFMPGLARFGLHLPASGRDLWAPAADVVRDEFGARWRESGADLTAARLLEWSLVYGATVGKVQHHPMTGFSVGYIQPWDFGVAREDIPELDEQDAFIHAYTLSMPQFERWVRGHPDEAHLVATANAHKSTGITEVAKNLNVFVTSVANQTVTGSIEGELQGYALAPQLAEPVVPFVDVWERQEFVKRNPLGRDEHFEDWVVTTLIHDERVLRRRNPDLPHVWHPRRDGALPAEQPFVMMVPRPRPNLIWGRPELIGLVNLQNELESLLKEMLRGVKKNLDPGKFFVGTPDWEEAGVALDSAGGTYGTSEPTGKLETVKIEIRPETFEVFRNLLEMFNEESGIPELLQTGEAGSGARATGHFGMAAGIAGGRIRKMAYTVEDAINAFATKGLHIMQRHDDTVYPIPKTQRKFLMAQLPQGTSIRVDAHSASPINQEKVQAEAVLMQRAQVIKPRHFVDLVASVNREALMHDADEMEEARAAASEQRFKLEEAKVAAKALKK